MRADRLLSLLLLLRRRGRLTAGQLAAELEVSARTVLRDVEALSAAGVPVYAERGRHGGFSLLPGYRPPTTELTAEETEALFLAGAQQSLDRLGLAAPLVTALRKLAVTLPADLDARVSRTSERILLDEVGWAGPEASLAELAAVQQAVVTNHRLRFGYTPRPPRRPGVRTVDPYGLVVAEGTWYLLAAHRGHPRSYRVSRMSGAQVLAAPSRRPEDLDLRALWRQMREVYDEQPSVAVAFRVRSTWAELALSSLRSQLSGTPERTPQDDGWVLVSGRVRSVLGTAATLAGFGDDVEVTEPAELRHRLAELGEQLVTRYRGAPRPSA